jgi:hypothetical protein
VLNAENKVFTHEDEPYRVQISAFSVGNDLVVIVSGGEKPHVGAVAVSIPRLSLANSEIVSSSTSVFTLVGHKEDDLAKAMAGKIAAALEKNVVLTAGIHVGNIPLDGIKKIQASCENVLEQLLRSYAVV